MNVSPRRRSSLRRRSAERLGLTLLELVMVVSILAILTALIVPGMNDQQEETRKTVAKASLKELRDVIANRYMQDMSHTVNPAITGKVALPQPNRISDGTTRVSTTQIDGSAAGLIPQMHFLFVNPNQFVSASTTQQYVGVADYDPAVRIGWNGPYVLTQASLYPDPTLPRFSTDPTNTGNWSSYGFTSVYGQPGDFAINDPWGSPYVTIIQQTMHGTPLYTAYVVSAGPNRRLDQASWTYTAGVLDTKDDLALPIKSWK